MKTRKPENSTKDSDDRISRAKRERYRSRDFGSGYDSRYRGGINRLNTEVERAWIERQLGTGPVLDAGAGTGRFSSMLARRGHTVTALDSSAAMLASLKAKAPGVNTVEGDIYGLPFESDSFGAVLCMHVLFHLPDWERVVAELARVLSTGGQLFFEMRSAEHAAAFAAAARALGLASEESTTDDPSSATFTASGKQVKKVLDSYGVSVERTLRYDIAHSYWYRPLNRISERLLARSPLARRVFARVELALGPACPGWLAYRTLYVGRKR